MRAPQSKPLRLGRLLLIALPLFFACCAGRSPLVTSGGAAETSAKRTDATAQRLALAGVPNFGDVTPTLYRGAQPTAPGFQALQQMGIAMVVNFRPENRETEQQIVTRLGMQYVSLPWSCRHPSNALVAAFLQLLRDNPSKKIFIHCHYGVDRTGLMIAAYRMAVEGWTPAQTTAEMHAFGFNSWHRSWCHALVAYEEGFPTQLEKDARLHALQPSTQTTAP